MNRNLLKISMLVVSASALFIAGCGPENMNAAFANDANVESKVEGPQGPGMQDQGPEMQRGSDMRGQGMQAGQPGPGGGPQAGPQDGTGGCPTGDCEIPPDPDTQRNVRLPDQHYAQPVKVMPTGEKQLATDIVDYHTTVHVRQPSQRQHTVHKHRNLINRYFKKVVYHPVFQRINRIIRTGSVSSQVMPVEEEVAPTVVLPCPAATEVQPEGGCPVGG